MGTDKLEEVKMLNNFRLENGGENQSGSNENPLPREIRIPVQDHPEHEIEHVTPQDIFKIFLFILSICVIASLFIYLEALAQ